VLVFLEHDRNGLFCVSIHMIMLVVGPVRSVQVCVEGQSYMENSNVVNRWFAVQLVVWPRVTVRHIQNCELQDISCYIFFEYGSGVV
jgi:hypothetical protein